MKSFLIAGVLALFAANAQAQAVTALQLVISSPTVVVSTTTLPMSVLNCGQTPLPAAVTAAQVNPLHLTVTDPNNPAAYCVYADPGTGPLASLPFANSLLYTATADWVNVAGTSSASAVSNPFSRPGVVAPAPTNLRLVP